MILTNPNDLDRSKTIVATSGYFDPLHIGHIECLELSKKQGDILVVIVNSDYQAILKKGKPFMPERERMAIVDSLRCVDYVFLSIDGDKTIVNSLALICPDIFTKGGDRFGSEVPEAQVCKDMDIKIVDGLGAKIQSSSTLIAGSLPVL